MVKALDPCGGDQEPLPLRMGPKIGRFESPLVHSHFGSYFSFLRHPLPVLYDFFLVLVCCLSFMFLAYPWHAWCLSPPFACGMRRRAFHLLTWPGCDGRGQHWEHEVQTIQMG